MSQAECLNNQSLSAALTASPKGREERKERREDSFRCRASEPIERMLWTGTREVSIPLRPWRPLREASFPFNAARSPRVTVKRLSAGARLWLTRRLPEKKFEGK